MQAPEKESERLAETPLLAAIRELRGDVERLIDDQKKIVLKAAAAWEAEPAIVRGQFPATPLVASASPIVPGPPPAKSPPLAFKPTPEPGPGESAAGDDIGRRLKDLSSRLERLKTSAQDSGDASTRPGG